MASIEFYECFYNKGRYFPGPLGEMFREDGYKDRLYELQRRVGSWGNIAQMGVDGLGQYGIPRELALPLIALANSEAHDGSRQGGERRAFTSLMADRIRGIWRMKEIFDADWYGGGGLRKAIETFSSWDQIRCFGVPKSRGSDLLDYSPLTTQFGLTEETTETLVALAFSQSHCQYGSTDEKNRNFWGVFFDLVEKRSPPLVAGSIGYENEVSKSLERIAMFFNSYAGLVWYGIPQERKDERVTVLNRNVFWRDFGVSKEVGEAVVETVRMELRGQG